MINSELREEIFDHIDFFGSLFTQIVQDLRLPFDISNVKKMGRGGRIAVNTIFDYSQQKHLES